MDIQKIENFINNGDSYTLVMLVVNNEALAAGQGNYQRIEEALDFLVALIKRKFGSGMIVTPFEGDTFLVFAPFILSKPYLMGIFDSLQQEYFDFTRANYQGKEASVGIGCITGAKQASLEELCGMAEQLIVEIWRQGKCGYKIMEND